MPDSVSLGRNLRRFRRLHGIKQSHMAEVLGVSQGSVSRWESGVHEPDEAAQERIGALIAARIDSQGDAALKRLILSSSLRIHLICDATHRLLAASPGRISAWRADIGAYLGTSLWRHASVEIIEAEGGLAARDWFEQPFQTCRFHTGANDSETIIITPGMMEWQSIPLADGRVGRLTTAIEAAAHAA